METNLWLEIAHRYGTLRNGKVYRNNFSTHAELEIGVVKETEEAALLYFSKRFGMYVQKVQELETDMAAAENKGSYLNKILHLKELLPTANALGDFMPLLNNLDTLEASLRTSISDNRKRNLEHKIGMVDEMESMVDDTDFKALSERLRELRLNWIKTGPVPPDDTYELVARYEKINAHFYEQRRQYIETRAIQIEERTAVYNGIISRQAELKAPGIHPGHIMKTINTLTQDWKTVGNIPKEQYEELKALFKDEKRELIRQVKRVFRDKLKAAEKLGENASPRQLSAEEIDQLKNYNLKKALLDEAKGVLDKADFRGAYPKVKEMQAAWHNIGPIPKTKIFINKDFLYICDRISEFSFLNKMLYQANPYYFRLVPKELAQAKINIMRDIIRKEENDIELFTEQIRDKERKGADMYALENKALVGRVNSQGRRLSVKKEILEELRAELTEFTDQAPSVN